MLTTNFDLSSSLNKEGSVPARLYTLERGTLPVHYFLDHEFVSVFLAFVPTVFLSNSSGPTHVSEQARLSLKRWSADRFI
jgi:hypothetical protein